MLLSITGRNNVTKLLASAGSVVGTFSVGRFRVGLRATVAIYGWQTTMTTTDWPASALVRSSCGAAKSIEWESTEEKAAGASAA